MIKRQVWEEEVSFSFSLQNQLFMKSERFFSSHMLLILYFPPISVALVDASMLTLGLL